MNDSTAGRRAGADRRRAEAEHKPAAPPRPQGIARLLHDAGFCRATSRGSTSRALLGGHSSGYHVRSGPYPGRFSVVVYWWPDSGDPRRGPGEDALAAEGSRWRGRYAEVIRAAGRSVEARPHRLIVTARKR